MKSDLELQRDVLRELTCADGVRVTDIGIGVRRGVVVLTGDVRSYAEKCAAERSALAVPGVLDVANGIRVHIPTDLVHTDAEVAYGVRRALDDALGTAAGAITSAVSNGWVTLRGPSVDLSTLAAAQTAVSRVRGVAGVLVQPGAGGTRQEAASAAA